MDLFKLIGKIVIKNEDANKEIDKTTKEGEKSSERFEKAFGKIGDFAKKMGKVALIGLGMVATGLIALSKKAIASYAEYEQLVGGVETLFKDSAGIVKRYADEAYRTAGLSANDYMKTVTGFSASLLQSLDGDTKKAAQKANMAVVDMADNANKMGTAIGDIQNAYQGFAKQNYTMLDNLKLGYGGTREEMQRLLRDAEAISGIHYDISSYADVVDAIHVIQTKMGVTGTTAKEASSTIQGSIGQMKGAFINFLTGMADPSQNFDKLLKNLVDSVINVTNQLIPRLAKMLPRLVEGISQIIANLAPQLPSIIEKLIPPILQGAMMVLQAILQNLPAIIMAIVRSLGKLLLKLVEPFKGLGKQFVGELKLAFEQVKSAVRTAINAVKNVFVVGWNAIKSAVMMIVRGYVRALGAELGFIKSVVTTALNGVKHVFSTVFNGAYNIVRSAIAKIKSVFNFSWKLPKLKLPHIKIKGKFSLSPPSTPSFGIDWYKKAMDGGMIMNKPTIFGYDSATNNFMAGGEAGSETVVGTNSLMTMIKNAVSENNNVILVRILEILEKIDSTLVDKIIEAFNSVNFVADDRELGRFIKKYAR